LGGNRRFERILGCKDLEGFDRFLTAIGFRRRRGLCGRGGSRSRGRYRLLTSAQEEEVDDREKNHRDRCDECKEARV
jgi:hypothetical protein